MVKAKKGKEGVSSPTHSLKLLNKLVSEFSSNFFDMNSRKVMREQLGNLPKILDEMDKKDEEYQQVPEVKIKSLVEELKANDEILKKNHENTREQIQIGLYKEGYSQANPMYDSFIERMELDLEEAQLKLDSGIVVEHPTFNFQTNPRWIEIQIILHNRNIVAIKSNLEDINEMLEKVKKLIVEQNERIKTRRFQIIEELKELKVDVSEYVNKVPDYIG